MAVLSKLLKYDLRANLKIFLFIWPAILVFGLLERVALMAELPSKISAIFVNLTTVLFVLAVIAACVFALVISVIRFYSGLLRDEGYLMFTLPVRPWQLVLSKLLTAFLTLIVTGLVSFVSVGILFGGIRGLLPSIRTSLEQSFGGIINGWSRTDRSAPSATCSAASASCSPCCSTMPLTSCSRRLQSRPSSC